VSGLSNGGFLVVWKDGRLAVPSVIRAQRYNNVGQKVGSEFEIASRRDGAQHRPSVAALGDGGFVVAWVSGRSAGSPGAIYARRYDDRGRPMGEKFAVRDNVRNVLSRPSITGLANGSFVVTWQQAARVGYHIFGRLYSSAGDGAAPFLVTRSVARSQPAIAGLADGGFVVVWNSGDDDASSIYARRFTSEADDAGGIFRVSKTKARYQRRPSVTAFASGGFLVTWTAPDGSGSGIKGQVFDATGARENTEFGVNATIVDDQAESSVSALAGSNFVVTWTSANQDGSLEGVYGQRFRFASF
jgi:hypothetical protein